MHTINIQYWKKQENTEQECKSGKSWGAWRGIAEWKTGWGKDLLIHDEGVTLLHLWQIKREENSNKAMPCTRTTKWCCCNRFPSSITICYYCYLCSTGICDQDITLTSGHHHKRYQPSQNNHHKVRRNLPKEKKSQVVAVFQGSHPSQPQSWITSYSSCFLSWSVMVSTKITYPFFPFL